MARLDTGWHAHPRILRLGLPAMGLHAWSISYCDHARSDGFIPMGAWPSLSGARAAVQALVDAGLWSVTDGGYRLHDYLDYNRSRAKIEALEAAKRNAGKVGGQASAQARASAHGAAHAQAESKHDPKHIAKQVLKQNSTPGPGPGVNYSHAAAVAPEGGVGETNLLYAELLVDHQRRLEQERAAAAAATNSSFLS